MPCGFHWFLRTSFKWAVLGTYITLDFSRGESSKKKCVTSPVWRHPPRIPPVSARLVPMVSQIAANTCGVMRNCLGDCTRFTGSESLTILPRPFSETLVDCIVRYLLLRGGPALRTLFIRYPIARINVDIGAPGPLCR